MLSINSTQPVTVPAVPEKIYNQLLITDLQIMMNRNKQYTLMARLQDYNQETEELGTNYIIIDIEDLAKKSKQMPQLTKALTDLTSAINLLVQEKQR